VELKEEVVEEENGGVSSIMPELLTGDLFFKKQGVEIGREVKKARERDTRTHAHTQGKAWSKREAGSIGFSHAKRRKGLQER
jgi:hypothetical protein